MNLYFNKLKNLIKILIIIILIIILLNIFINFIKKSKLFSNNKVKEGFITNYVQFEHDCGNQNISNYSTENIKSITNSNLESCKSVCNTNSLCKGFSWNKKAENTPEFNCILKKNNCSRNSDLKDKDWNFFKKLQYKKENQDCIIKTGDRGKILTLNNTTLLNCEEKCSEIKDCKGFSYVENANQDSANFKCTLKTNDCDTEGAVGKYEMSSKPGESIFAKKIIQVPNLAGKWYGIELTSGPINIQQQEYEISGNYGESLSSEMKKINRVSGQGLINDIGDKILWKWKNPSQEKPIEGNLEIINGKVEKIIWDNEEKTVWHRKFIKHNKFKFPKGYIENIGTCGYSTSQWDSIHKNNYYKHTSANKNIGIKTNPECAEACNNDSKCYAFQNMPDIQPSTCTLFYEPIKSFDVEGKLGTIDKKDSSCYTKVNRPLPSNIVIKTPKGYKGKDGCCSSINSPSGYNNSINMVSKIDEYDSKSAEECANLCNKNQNCYSFSIGKNKKISKCLLWPKGFEASDGELNGIKGECLKKRKCYTKIENKLLNKYSNTFHDSSVKILDFNPPLPTQNIVENTDHSNNFNEIIDNHQKSSVNPNNLRPLNIMTSKLDKIAKSLELTKNYNIMENFVNMNNSNFLDFFNFQHPLYEFNNNNTVKNFVPENLNLIEDNNYCLTYKSITK